MFTFLEQFKRHIDQMELEFEHAVVSSQQMNGMLATYEATLLESYGTSSIQESRRPKHTH